MRGQEDEGEDEGSSLLLTFDQFFLVVLFVSLFLVTISAELGTL